MKINFSKLRKPEYFSQSSLLVVLNIFLIVGQFLYLTLRYKYLNDAAPFWYSLPWGDPQLDYKRNLYLLPIISSMIFTGALVLNIVTRKYFARYLHETLMLIATFANAMITYSLVRIIFAASVPFPSLINPVIFQFAAPFLTSFVLALVLAPRFINFVREKGIITNPDEHAHPAMILKKPSARAAGVFFTMIFILVGLIFVQPSKEIWGIYAASLLLALLGFADDYQNTHPRSFLKIFENPLLRLSLLFLIVSLVVPFGIIIKFVGSPFGGIWQFSNLEFFSAVLTVVWIVWILNLLSWSNGIDGQYCGIIGISSVVVGLLALRFSPLLPGDINIAKLAFISAGATFGLVRYTWHPSKIMWGFSAMSAGLILASLSILVNAKVATSIIMILIPFLDATVTFIRRLLQKKNPLKGDRGHLHHLLMERGWSIPQIAAFYWITTAVFGLIGLLSSEKYTLLITLTLAGVVAFFIILLNLKSALKRSQLPMLE